MNHFTRPRNRRLDVPVFEFATESMIFPAELPLDPSQAAVGNQPPRSSTAGFSKKQIENRFLKLTRGQVGLIDGGDVKRFGTTGDLTANVLVSKPSFYRRIMTGGTIGAAESYIDGDWVSDDLTSLIRIMIRNLGEFSQLERSWAWLKNRFDFFRHLNRKNTVSGSRQNIHEHYDLGNEFYQLFLDETMNYSSGVFDSSRSNASVDDELLDASVRKMNQICRKLQLAPHDHVLEIGSGWGGLAIHMATKFGCRVTTTTISQEQFKLATDRVDAAGVSDRVTVLLKDYRQLEGRFDKIVSVEMIEAVGHQYYDQFFACCGRLLKPDGAMLLQAITIGEQHYQHHIKHVDFIRKYIFPGGCLPSITALATSAGKVTDMRMLKLDDITPHYATTLTHWRARFLWQLDAVRALGFDDKFIRMWHFYLCYCEAAFAERRVHTVHLMFAKPDSPIDPGMKLEVPSSEVRELVHPGAAERKTTSLGSPAL